MMTYAGYILILTFVSIIAWLSNREINKSLEQARRSEKFLTGERNSLEKIIHKRTDELLISERMRTAELERNAKFGELSQGLFHDLMNPLSSLSLFVENMKTQPEYSNNTKEMLEKTITASRRMESFMNSIRHTTAEATDIDNTSANLDEELGTVHDLLAYKARMAGVKIIINRFDSIIININPFRLHQLLLNTISNALDACVASLERYEQSQIEGILEISASRNIKEIRIIIEDNGCGIPKDKIEEIFDHPFTTKSKGTGIGLTTVKKIVDEELHGTISIVSKEDVGTTCTIIIPQLDK